MNLNKITTTVGLNSKWIIGFWFLFPSWNHVWKEWSGLTVFLFPVLVGTIDVGKARLMFWDLGGQEELQSLWDKVSLSCVWIMFLPGSAGEEPPHVVVLLHPEAELLSALCVQYYAESHGVIYVIDSTDEERLSESKEAFGEWHCVENPADRTTAWPGFSYRENDLQRGVRRCPAPCACQQAGCSGTTRLISWVYFQAFLLRFITANLTTDSNTEQNISDSGLPYCPCLFFRTACRSQTSRRLLVTALQRSERETAWFSRAQPSLGNIAASPVSVGCHFLCSHS